MEEVMMLYKTEVKKNVISERLLILVEVREV